MKQSRAIMLAIAFTLGLSACASSETSRSTGQTIDDASITARVKTKIAQTEGIGQAATINVDTYRGQVSLAGFVDNEQEKRSAGQVAAQVAGVQKVHNNLEIKRSN